MRVLLVDDHQLMVEALTSLLKLHSYDVVGTAADGNMAVAQALALHPDLILMDLRMPHCDGLAATRLIKAQQPEARIVMLTTSAEDEDLFAAIQSGASGYLLKSIGGEDFVDALRGLEEGIPPFSPGLAARLLDEFARLPATPETGTSTPETAPPAIDTAPSALTERQTDVLRLIATGMTYHEVGVALSISERTVRYHLAEIMDRLHLEHRSQVIAYAGRMGLRGCP
ncbi:MAG: response regulator transcription factor [Anaerolineae bacterium]